MRARHPARCCSSSKASEQVVSNDPRILAALVYKYQSTAVASRSYAIAEMPQNRKRRKFSLESLNAGDRLLKAIKDELRKKGEKIDYGKLRRDRYSEAMIG